MTAWDRSGAANPNWRGGKTFHPLYDIYMDMIGRCHRPTHQRYISYGGRGIAVCDQWRADFWAFVFDIGERPTDVGRTGRSRISLDRIDNDGPYAPQNTRWADKYDQARNRRPQTPHDRDEHTGQFVSDVAS